MRTDKNGIRTGRHCVFLLHAHLVFVTKYRHRVFGDRHLARMEEIMRAVCDDFEAELVEFNGETNHVHLLVNFPPKVALLEAGQQPQGRLLPPAAAGVPRPRPALLARATPVVRLVLRRLRRRRAAVASCGSTSSSRTVPSRARLGPWRASPRGPSPPP